MIFNSYAFLAFFPIVTLAYYLMPMRARRPWLLAASYYFYMCWNAQYALLIAASTLVTYLCALALGRMEAKAGRRAVLALGLAINLGILCFFKYFGFFTDTFARIAARLGVRLAIPAFDVLLPVGISFYTFQILSYVVDVYRGDVPAQKSFLKLGTYIAMFPQLIAGPIVRYADIAPQLDSRQTTLEDVSSGACRFVIGLSKKVLLANNIHELAKAVVKCCNDAQDNGNLLKLESELREVNKGINNLLDLIEAGRNSQAMADRLEQREQQRKLLEQNIAKEKVLHRIPTEDEVIFFFNNFIQGNIDSLEYNRYLIDILVNSIYLSDEEDGTQKMTVLLNTQNGQETVTLNDLTQCSSNVHMVHHRGLEPRTH